MNKWLKHVAKIRAKNKSKSYKECLQIASKSYKQKGGGAFKEDPQMNKKKKIVVSKAEAIDLVSDDDEEVKPTCPPKKPKHNALIDLDFRDPPKGYKYNANDFLGSLFYYLILKRNNINCWIRHPETGDFGVKWDMREPPSKRLKVFGDTFGENRNLLKKMLLDCKKKCSSSWNFAVINVVLRLSKKEGHQNYIVVNLNTNEAFRYDPNGKTSHTSIKDGELFDGFRTDLLDNEMLGLFARIGFNYKGSKEVCPDMGVQVAAYSTTNSEGHSGFCQMWGGIFLDTFLSYPKLTVEGVEKLIQKKFDSPDKLTAFILKISAHISNAKKRMFPNMKKIAYKKAVQKKIKEIEDV